MTSRKFYLGPRLKVIAGIAVAGLLAWVLYARIGGASTPATAAPTRFTADFARGVNHAHIHRRGRGYGSPTSAEELAALQKLGVNCIAITPFGYQKLSTADQIRGFTDEDLQQVDRDVDPSLMDADLAAEVASAKKLGLHVMIKPHIWAGDFWNGSAWHATVQQESPEAHARWWQCYRAMILHYARLAQRTQAESFCVGTELVAMTTAHPDEWRQLITDVRAVYTGKVAYAAHWDREFTQIDFWDALDCIGITAYFPLDLPPGATVEQLIAAWRPHVERIAKVQAKFKRPVEFLEIGYRPVDTTYQKPWLYHGGNADPEAQVRAFEAFFRVFAAQSWFKGVYIWKTFTDPAAPRHGLDSDDFTFRGRPAQAVIAKWYGGATAAN